MPNDFLLKSISFHKLPQYKRENLKPKIRLKILANKNQILL